MTTTTHISTSPTQPGQVSAWPAMVVLAALAMGLIDISIVNVATDSIRVNLHGSATGIEWVVAGYTLSYAVLLVTGSRCGAIFGFARVFTIGVAIFTAASLGCALAPNEATLVAARLLQGSGAAFMGPQVMTILQLCYSGKRRTRVLGWYGAILALGTVAGQLLGGLLLSANPAGLTWRTVFLINIPVGVAILVAGRRVLPALPRRTHVHFDAPGTVTFGLAVTALLVALIFGHDAHWAWWIDLCLVGAVVMAVVFAWTQRRAERRGGAPIAPRAVLRAPGMVAALAVILCSLAGYNGYMLVMSLQLQHEVGLSALHTGLAFVPFGAAFAVTAMTASRVREQLGIRLIPSGMAVAAVGFGALALLYTATNQPGWSFGLLTAVAGAGSGVVVSSTVGAGLRHVTAGHASEASALLATAIQSGSALGVGVLGAAYLSLLARQGAADAVQWTLLAVMAVNLIGAVAAIVLWRSTTRAR